MASEQNPFLTAPGTKHEPLPAALEQMQFSACDGFELFPWWLHGDPYPRTGHRVEEHTLVLSPVASVQMPSTTAPGTEQNLLPDAS